MIKILYDECFVWRNFFFWSSKLYVRKKKLFWRNFLFEETFRYKNLYVRKNFLFEKLFVRINFLFGNFLFKNNKNRLHSKSYIKNKPGLGLKFSSGIKKKTYEHNYRNQNFNQCEIRCPQKVKRKCFNE